MSTEVLVFQPLDSDQSSSTDVSSIKSESSPSPPIPDQKPSNSPFDIENLLKSDSSPPASQNKDNNTEEQLENVEQTKSGRVLNIPVSLLPSNFTPAQLQALYLHQLKVQSYWFYIAHLQRKQQQRQSVEQTQQQKNQKTVVQPVTPANAMQNRLKKIYQNKNMPVNSQLLKSRSNISRNNKLIRALNANSAKRKLGPITSSFKLTDTKQSRKNDSHSYTDKKNKLELDFQMIKKEIPFIIPKDRPVLTREEYNLKCHKAAIILMSEVDDELIENSQPSHHSFLALIDTAKVMDLSVSELNSIIEDSSFSEEERAYIRELRRKAMNKKAAEECRRRKKSEEHHLSEEFDSLMATRQTLISERDNLSAEINFYQKSITSHELLVNPGIVETKAEPMDYDDQDLEVEFPVETPSLLIVTKQEV